VTAKTLSRVQVKDADKGIVEAVFSTFNVVDADGDVTLPGAFDDGAEWIMSAYGHKSWEGALPVGKGIVRATDTEAIFSGQFFMNTTGGRNTFEVVKQMGDLQEWSYSCSPDKFSYGEFEGSDVRFLEHIRPHGEVSPVIKGAGVGTRTTAVKGLTFSDEAQAVVADLEHLVGRAADVMAMRQEKGKALGADSSALLQQVEAQCKRLTELLAVPEPVITIPPNVLRVEYLRHIARIRGITA
jgi:hypothetical protein